MGRARNATLAVSAIRQPTDPFFSVLGLRRGSERGTPLSLAGRLLAADPRDGGEALALITVCERGNQTELTSLAVSLLAERPQLLLSPYPYRQQLPPAEAFLHAFFSAHCRAAYAAWTPELVMSLLDLCGYPLVPEEDRDPTRTDNNILELLAGGDTARFREQHYEAFRTDLHNCIKDDNEAARKSKLSELLELAGPPAGARWLQTTLDYQFLKVFVDLMSTAATDNPLPTLRRALGTAGVARLARRKDIGSVEALYTAMEALPQEGWRLAFLDVMNPTASGTGGYPGRGADPANPMPDYSERQRRLETYLAALLVHLVAP